MTLGEKLKDIRKRFGFSQEQLAEIMNVSRQAITKWESDGGMPDVGNLQELSKVFGLTVDYLLNDDNQLPALVMRKELDKTKYKSKFDSYYEILKEYYGEPYEVYVLTRSKKMNFFERIIDFCVGGSSPAMIFPITTADGLSDLSPYYLVMKDNMKFLVNIKDWVLEVIELPNNTNTKKFVYGKNTFRNSGKLKLK